MNSRRTYLHTLLLTCCMTACTSNPWNDWGGMEPGEMPGGEMNGGSASSDATGSLLDFDITWEDFPTTDFTDTAEQVPTDEDDEEYEDFLENSSFASQIKIAYSEGKATVTGSVEGVTVTADGAHVTVNSTVKGVEYLLSGSTTDGSLKVYSEKKFKLTLNSLTLASKQSAAINIQSGKRVFIESKAGTENVLTDAADYTNTVEDEDQKACLFSEGQLIFCGSGSLTVTGNYKHGICSDDYVFIHSGTNITVAAAKKDAIHTNDKIVIGGGKVTLTPSGDGLDCEEGFIDIRGGLLKADIAGTASKAMKATTDIRISGGKLLLFTSGDAEYDSDDQDLSSSACIKCDGNLSITEGDIRIKSTGAAGKGINCDGTLEMSGGSLKVITTGKQYVYGNLDSSPKAIKAEGNLTISDGTVWVKATGGEGSEGIESKAVMTISGGEVLVSTYDDSMNAASAISLTGGNIYCYSSGNDAIDSNGTLAITGGVIVAVGTTQPEGGIDSDQNNRFSLSGGTLVAVGGSNNTPGSPSQCVLAHGTSATAGTLYSITAADGSHVMSFTIPRNYTQMSLLFSSAKLQKSTSYSIYSGGSVSGGTTFCGLTTGGSYTKGNSVTTFTTNNSVTTVGNSSGGPGGARPGGW